MTSTPQILRKSSFSLAKRSKGTFRHAPRFMGLPSFMRQTFAPNWWTDAGIDIGFVGVPFDGGVTNRPGARHGCREVRNMSSFCRDIHDEYKINPYELKNIADCGDVPIDHIFDIKKAHEEIENYFMEIGKAGIQPCSCGGDHSVTLPIVKGLRKGLDITEPLAMIHIDAHTDTWDEMWGSDSHHGAPFRRLVESGDIDPKKTIQIGIRGSQNSTAGWDYSRDIGFTVLGMNELTDKNGVVDVSRAVSEALRVVGDAPCYISFDIDAIDPAYAPGTGTPEFGGFTPREVLKLLRGFRKKLKLVGTDLVEVSPPFDHSNNTSLLGATLMYEMVCLLSETHSMKKANFSGVSYSSFGVGL